MSGASKFAIINIEDNERLDSILSFVGGIPSLEDVAAPKSKGVHEVLFWVGRDRHDILRWIVGFLQDDEKLIITVDGIEQTYHDYLESIHQRQYSGLSSSFTVVFSEELTPEQVKGTLEALADYFRACGGAGFEIDFEFQDVRDGALVHA